MIDSQRGITEIVLKEWRYGQTQSERLCAGLLSLEEFSSIDPQAPLGGSDDLKDVVCIKNGQRFIVAVYFPRIQKTFKDVELKFLHDIKGVKDNKAKGMAFFTNQPLSLKERASLKKIAKEKNSDLDLYHLERIRLLLDSPAGYGLRQEFLRIEMTPSEMIAAIGVWQKNLHEIITYNPSAQAMADHMFQTQSTIVSLLAANYQKSSDLKKIKSSLKRRDAPELPVTSYLTVNQILFIHRAITNNQYEWSGKFRTVQTWITTTGYPITKAVYIPPVYERVPSLISNLINSWNKQYGIVNESSRNKKIFAIASFHANFLSIHPFADGNGRISRLIMEQQIEDLLGITIQNLFSKKRVTYFKALQEWQKGRKDVLEKLLKNELLEYKGF